MNITLGVLGIAVAMASSAIGVFMVAARQLQRVKLCAWLVLGGAALSVFAMERALITRDFLGVVCGRERQPRHPRAVHVATLWAALEGSILLWALILAGYLVWWPTSSATGSTTRWWDGPWRCCSSCACSSSC